MCVGTGGVFELFPLDGVEHPLRVPRSDDEPLYRAYFTRLAQLSDRPIAS